MSLIHRPALRASQVIVSKAGKRPRPSITTLPRPLPLVHDNCNSSRRCICSVPNRRSWSVAPTFDQRVPRYPSACNDLGRVNEVARCQINSIQQLRWRSNSSGRSDVDGDAGHDLHATTSSASKDMLKRRRRPSTKHSPLSQMTSNHPKNAAPPPNYRTLTRKQILRLTPKQRKNLHNQRRQDYKDSRSYLDQARSNVRKNLRFLGERADTNLKKNITTMKRLFKGEEVWNDAEKPSAKREERLVDMARGIEWERAPAEIKANFLSNLSKVQNWLHKTTDGMIPSSQYVGIHGEGEAARAGSIATRVQQFHEMKQSQTIEMDNAWFAKNLFVALLPGLALNLYFQSKQGEMKEYYKKLEEKEREKILGPGAGIDGSNSSPSFANERQSGGMSMSTALITEGGSTWDKLKMTVSDLFLGGAQERINQHQAIQGQEAEGSASSEYDGSTGSAATNVPDDGGTAEASSSRAPDVGSTTAEVSDSAADKDPTIQMLLERIQALEGQLGKSEGQMTEEELREQRAKEHELKYSLQRQQQSPIQNRRDDYLRKKWLQEEASDREARDSVSQETGEDDSKQSYSFVDVFSFAKLTLEPKLESMKESAMQSAKDAANALGLSEGATAASGEPAAKLEAPAPSTRIGMAGETLTADATDSQTVAIYGADESTEAEQDEVKPNGIRSWAGGVWRRIRRPRDGRDKGQEQQ